MAMLAGLRGCASGYGTVGLSATLAGALSLAGPASAATLTSAFPRFAIGTLPGATFPGIGATGAATSDLSASLSAGAAFNGAFTTTIATSAAPPLTVVQVIVTNSASATFIGASPEKVGGSLAIEGAANVYGVGGFPGGGAPLLAVPLELGTPNTLAKSAGGVAITVIGGPWTAGTAVVTGVPTTTPGSQRNENGTATAMGDNGITPGGTGTLVLVALVKMITHIAGNLPAFGVLTLEYVPEPSQALLVGAGVAVLAALGRGRRRSVRDAAPGSS
jgi:hypothetical protein